MIRKALKRDLAVIEEIEQRSFDNPWSLSQFEYEFSQNPYATIWVIENDEKEIVGYCDLWIIFDRGEIATICIDEKYRHQGYGQQLMKHIDQKCIDELCENISLEVRVNNSEALALYEKNGYSIINTKPGYYKTNDGPIDAYLMMKGI